jgi:two-component system copper resistance phosphate regulon response regulator CusR
MKILVVDDDGLLCEILCKFLQKHGIMVDVCSTGEEGLSLAKQYQYDAIVLDVMLPTIDGFAVLKSLRAQDIRTPLLLLTVRGTAEDRIQGLELGADDYLPKPFDYDEFLARLLNVIRRGKNESSTSRDNSQP